MIKLTMKLALLIFSMFVFLLIPEGNALANDSGLLDQLLGNFAKTESMQLQYTEKRSFDFSNKPVISTGTIAFRRPDLYTQNVKQPVARKIMISGNTVTVEQNGHVEKISLSNYPQLYAPMLSMRYILSGNKTDLTQYYAVNTSGSIDNWTLELKPRVASMQKYMQSIKISGSQQSLTNFLLQQTNGDKIAMQF